MRRWGVLGLLIWTGFSLAGCGGAPDGLRAAEQVLPHIPGSTAFGPVYPRLNELLNTVRPDVDTALRETRAWAEAHLPEFRAGACAAAQVVSDGAFTSAFGRTTLGVTLPWMQIYIRDGRRDPDPFLWTDATMFLSTVLHEFAHGAQRAAQAAKLFGAGDCAGAMRELTIRQGIWVNGFERLRQNAELGAGYSNEERQLLYHWTSPIERARDEVHAALLTVRWMNERPDELNAYTMGGANNWAYALQFMQQLRLFSSSNCFSPDDAAFREEQRIYAEEMPTYLAELEQYEPGMRALLRQQNAPALSIPLGELRVSASPSGRLGTACNNAALSELPRLPLKRDSL